MGSHASVIVSTPCGSTVHLVGVSHTSAYYGKLAHDTISSIKPDVVVLEIDEGRLREQARRARLWIQEKNRSGIVEHALRPFLTSGSIFDIHSLNRPRQAYTLQNEGSALLEGGIYGSEVVLACEAAMACGSAIVLADRNKALSNVRLQAAMQSHRLKRVAALPDDDWTLLREAAVTAAHNLTHLCTSALSLLCLTDAQLFSEQLHPIFLLAEVEEYHPVLAAVGCDNAEEVVAAIRRLMTDGSRSAAQIDAADLAAVQDGIAKIEGHKHRMRQQVFSCVQQQPGSYSTMEGCAQAAHREQATAGSPDAEQSALLELSHRFDSSQPAHVPQSAEHLSHLEWLAKNAVQRVVRFLCGTVTTSPSRGDAFSQWCWRGTGHMQSFDFDEHVSSVASAIGASTTDVVDAERSPYYHTTVYERDGILAQRIWSVAAGADTKSVVAVVGANHIPGILRNWPHAGSKESQEAVAPFLHPPAHDAEEAVDVRWKAFAVDKLALGMEAVAVGTAVAVPWRLVQRITPAGMRWAPLTVLAAVAIGSAACSAARHAQMARLVQNVAAHQDAVDAQLALAPR